MSRRKSVVLCRVASLGRGALRLGWRLGSHRPSPPDFGTVRQTGSLRYVPLQWAGALCVEVAGLQSPLRLQPGSVAWGGGWAVALWLLPLRAPVVACPYGGFSLVGQLLVGGELPCPTSQPLQVASQGPESSGLCPDALSAGRSSSGQALQLVPEIHSGVHAVTSHSHPHVAVRMHGRTRPFRPDPRIRLLSYHSHTALRTH